MTFCGQLISSAGEGGGDIIVCSFAASWLVFMESFLESNYYFSPEEHWVKFCWARNYMQLKHTVNYSAQHS